MMIAGLAPKKQLIFTTLLPGAICHKEYDANSGRNQSYPLFLTHETNNIYKNLHCHTTKVCN